jgi:DNA-binding transcriptional LysR family regulator
MTNLNDLQHIREFVQIADSGSISAAAKVLSMAQPTLSRHLAALETQIGSPLLRRDTHTMSLTEAGRILLADARELLNLADRLGSRLRSERQSLRGHLRIVSVVDVGQWIVSRVLSRFQKQHPHGRRVNGSARDGKEDRPTAPSDRCSAIVAAGSRDAAATG